jgi:predicted N-acyltransferase
VPFTPATGPRLLAAPGSDRALVCRGLVAAAAEIAERAQLSSAHWLFTDQTDTAELEKLPLLHRLGCQFHWHNPGFRDFQDYLDALTSKRRKQVRRERREAAAAPVSVELLHGDELREEDIAAYHALYCSTYDRKWGYPTLSVEFFARLAERMPRGLILILAKREGRCVAGAHLLRGETALFGRNWGCSERHRSLHFEICYYRGIEYCIEHGLSRFEAGAQGEHKLTRGFTPVGTHSFHWIRDSRFRRAIEEFVTRERAQTRGYIEAAARHSPYRRGDACK